MTASCATCERLRDGLRCAAYPEQIPWPVLMGGVDHLDLLPGDHGLRYVPRAALDKGVKYSPDQPRDDHGRWTSDGSSAEPARQPDLPPTSGRLGARDASTRPDPEFDRLKREVLAVTDIKRVQNADGARIAAVRWLAEQRAAAGVADKAQRVALWGLPWVMVQDVVPTLARFYQDYPRAADDLRSVDILPSSQFKSSGPTVAAHAWDDGTFSRLEGNGYRMRQVDDYALSRGGWFPEGTNKVRGVLTHELGHVVNHHLDRQLNGRPPGDRARDDWKDLQKQLMSSPRLSAYSMASAEPRRRWREGFAEAFAQYRLAPVEKWTHPTHQLAAFLERPWVAAVLGSAPHKAVDWFFVARAYNPDEPREPAGSPAGGQWTSGDSGAAGTATAERDAPAAPPSEATIRAAFEGTFGGLTARVAFYTPYVESDGRLSGAQVTGQVRTADGREVGQFYRSFHFSDGEVTHAGFALQPDQQGQGFATAFIAHSEAAYRAMGMKRITVAANTDVGGYAWAQQGYDFDHYYGHGQVEQMAQRVWAFANQAADRSPIPAAGQRAVYSEANRLLKRVQQREAVSAREMSQVGRQYPWVDPRSGRQLWAGKAAMLGSKWSGEKVL
jgi:GNAT superfamily N-acetyltransferase